MYFVSCCVRLYLFATVKRSMNKTYQSLIRCERRSGLCLEKIRFIAKVNMKLLHARNWNFEVVDQKVKRATKHAFDLMSTCLKF